MKPRKIFLLSLALFFCLMVQLSHADEFPQSVIAQMATRNMRHHHYMWHQIRGNWNKFSNATKHAFKAIGWAPPNPARDSKGKVITNNYAGEDFLCMHRQMIRHARQIAASHNESTEAFVSWKSIPAPGDKKYPVPPPFQKGNISNYYAHFKTDAHYKYMRKLEMELKNPAKLRNLTLNQLGLYIENRLHNSLHFRWADFSAIGYRTGDVRNANMPHINKKWDDPAYNWMGDSYGSHVNPMIYKVHGWIDDRVEDWRRAHNLSNITWHGTWTGGPMSTLGGAFANHPMAGMSANSPMHMNGNSTSETKHMQDMQGNSTNSTDSDAVGDVLAQAVEIFHQSGVNELTMEADHKNTKQHRKSSGKTNETASEATSGTTSGNPSEKKGGSKKAINTSLRAGNSTKTN